MLYNTYSPATGRSKRVYTYRIIDRKHTKFEFIIMWEPHVDFKSHITRNNKYIGTCL